MKFTPVVFLLAVFSSACVPLATSPGGSGYLRDFRTSPVSSRSQPPAHERGYWDGDSVSGPAQIVIDRAQQKAFFYKGDALVGMAPISSGKSTHVTPAGSFKVTQKSPDHKSSLYGVIRDLASGVVVNADADTRKDRTGPGEVFEHAPMPYFLRFNGAIGMHVGHLPGYPASHGCVRLPRELAVKFFENAELGTPVVVK